MRSTKSREAAPQRGPLIGLLESHYKPKNSSELVEILRHGLELGPFLKGSQQEPLVAIVKWIGPSFAKMFSQGAAHAPIGR